MGDLSEYAHAENMAALPTNDRESLLANRYQLQQVLGQGGFGRTFLALDRHRFNEPCVVKEFLPQQQGRTFSEIEVIQWLKDLLPVLTYLHDRMLQDIPSNRYQTAAANLADLEQSSTDSRSTATSTIAPPKAPPTVIRLTPESPERCERESIEYVGPIGKFLVQNAIAKNPHRLFRHYGLIKCLLKT